MTWQSVRAACWWEAPAGLQGRWKPLSRGRGGLRGRGIFPCCQSCYTAHHLPPCPSPRQVSLESVLEVMATKLPPPPAPLHPARSPGKKVCFHFISLALSSHPTSISNLQNPLCSMSRLQPHACLSVPPTGPVPHPLPKQQVHEGFLSPGCGLFSATRHNGRFLPSPRHGPLK